MARKSNVDLILGARNETKKAIAEATADLRKFAAEGNRLGELQARKSVRSGLEAQIIALSEAYKKAKADAAAFAREMTSDTSGDLTAKEARALRTNFAAARDEIKTTKAALIEYKTALAGVSSGGGRASVIDAANKMNLRAAQMQAQLATQTQRAGAAAANAQSGFLAFSRGVGAAVTPVASLNRQIPAVIGNQNRLTASTIAASQAAFKQASALRAQSYAQGIAARAAAAYATRQGRGPLGLRPYEMTNLSYQINDVVTGLASGQKPMQVFAQQAGQIIQIFPRLGTAILRSLPMLGTVAGAIGVFAAAMGRARQNAQDAVDPLAALSRELQRLGMESEDVQKLFTILRDAGVAAEDMRQLAMMARELADVLGVDVVAAGDKLATAWSGNIDSIRDLDKELNFLTSTQYESLRAMEDNGDAAGALEEAHDLLAERLQETVDLAAGPWTQAWTSLGNAWNSLLGYLANTAPVQIAIAAMNRLGAAVAAIMAKIPGAGPGVTTRAASSNAADDLTLASQDEVRAALAEHNKMIEHEESLALSARSDKLIGELKAERDRLQAELVKPSSLLPDPTSLGLAHEQEGPAAPTKAQLAAQQELNKNRLDGARELSKEIEAQIKARAEELEISGRTERVQAAEKALAEARNAALKKGVELTAEQAEAIRASADTAFMTEAARKNLEKQTEAQASLNKLVGDQVQSRKEEAALSALSERDQAIQKDLLLAKNAAAEHGLTLSEEQVRLTTEAAAAAFDAAEAEKARNKAEKGGASRKGKKPEDVDAKARKEAEKEINTLLEYRRELMKTITYYQESGEPAKAAGLQTQLEGVNAELEAAIPKAIAMWEAVGGAEANAAILNLQRTQLELKTLASDAVVTGKQVNEMLAEGGTDAFGDMIENIVAGEDAIKSMRQAFAQFAADFLIEIGKMILKQALLNALQAGGGASGGVGGAIASAIGSVFHEGGVIGGSAPTRRIPAAAWHNAMRYHTGGEIGIKPNERAIIGKVGEEVLTEDDPRHVRNGGKSGGGATNLKVVNVIDPAEMMAAAIADTAGQRVLMNWLNSNKRSVRAQLGV